MTPSILDGVAEREVTGQLAPRYHTPVLLRETIEALNVQPGGRYIDCTLGTTGHSLAILKASSPGGQLLGIDADPQAIAISYTRLSAYRKKSLLINDNFVNLSDICTKHNFSPVNGILFDFGLSSLQLDTEDRGFSFQHDSPLDMRFDPEQAMTASDVVNTFSESDLSSIIAEYGEEPRSRQIASQIVASRPLRTTLDLSRAVLRSTGTRRGKIHPATKTFQALRIAVNHELDNIGIALAQTTGLLGFHGRLVVISYHSLEDRLVKNMMRQETRECICPPQIIQCICGHKSSLRLVHAKAIRPSDSEVESNPRSRSAKLRTAERVS